MTDVPSATLPRRITLTITAAFKTVASGLKSRTLDPHFDGGHSASFPYQRYEVSAYCLNLGLLTLTERLCLFVSSLVITHLSNVHGLQHKLVCPASLKLVFRVFSASQL